MSGDEWRRRGSAEPVHLPPGDRPGREGWSPRDVLELQDRGIVTAAEARRLLGLDAEAGAHGRGRRPSPGLKGRVEAVAGRHLIHRVGWGATWRLGSLVVLFVLPHRELLLAWLLAGLLMAAGLLSGAIRRRGWLGSAARVAVLAGAAYLVFYLPGVIPAAALAVLALAAVGDLVWTVGGSELAWLRPAPPPEAGR